MGSFFLTPNLLFLKYSIVHWDDSYMMLILCFCDFGSGDINIAVFTNSIKVCWYSGLREIDGNVGQDDAVIDVLVGTWIPVNLWILCFSLFRFTEFHYPIQVYVPGDDNFTIRFWWYCWNWGFKGEFVLGDDNISVYPIMMIIFYSRPYDLFFIVSLSRSISKSLFSRTGFRWFNGTWSLDGTFRRLDIALRTFSWLKWRKKTVVRLQ